MWNVADFVTNALYLATIALRLRAYYDVSWLGHYSYSLRVCPHLLTVQTNKSLELTVIYCDVMKVVKQGSPRKDDLMLAEIFLSLWQHVIWRRVKLQRKC